MPVTDRARWRELEPLLDRALELSDDERVTWLEQLRSRSPDLADELTSLLSGEAIADRRGFLSEPIDVPLVGLELGGYTLERPLGHGGMGSVWLARRTDGRFEGRAAVKLLNLALLSASGQERFRREGSLLARLTHPGIARLLDAGVSSTAQPYLVLEYIEGQRIDLFAKEHALSREARIRLVLQVLAAVTHAHANLVVHRDIKPSNILVTSDGTAKLLDFGIAKLLSTDGASDQPPLTAEGGRALTPEFAAPEQVRGEAVTTATDVYAVGVLLYLLLSGRHPTGEGCHTSLEAITALFEREPKRLGLGDLDNVVAKALAKTPESRYQTAAAFAEDLQRYLKNEPVSAQRDSLAYRARKFVRRNRVPVTAAFVTTAGLLVSTLVAVNRMREARRQRDTAVAEGQRADAQLEFQYFLLTNIGQGRVTVREILDQGVSLLKEQYLHEPRVGSAIALSLATAYQELGDPPRQLEMLTLADSLAAISNAEKTRLLAACSKIAYYSLQQMTNQVTHLIDSIRPWLAKADESTEATCLGPIVGATTRRQKFDSAAALGRRAAMLMEHTGDTTSLEYVSILNSEANALENQKKRREALAIYQRTAAVLDGTGRGGAVARNVIRNNIGIALSNLGEMTAAEPVLREAVATFQRSSDNGFVHPAILINYCRTELFLQHYDSATKWYGQLYTQSVNAKDAIMEGEGALGMARVELERGRADEAATWITLVKRADARRSTPVGTVPELDASLEHLRGNSVRALAMFDTTLRGMGYDTGKRAYQMRGVLILAATTALDAGQPGKALEYATAAHAIARSDSLSETRSAYVGEAAVLEGRALAATGDTVAARNALRHAVAALRAGVGPSHPRTREAESVLAKLGA